MNGWWRAHRPRMNQNSAAFARQRVPAIGCPGGLRPKAVGDTRPLIIPSQTVTTITIKNSSEWLSRPTQRCETPELWNAFVHLCRNREPWLHCQQQVCLLMLKAMYESDIIPPSS